MNSLFALALLPSTLRSISAKRFERILVGLTGRYGNVLKIRPPMVIRRPQIDQLVRALENVLSTSWRHAGNSNSLARINEGILTEKMVAALASTEDRTIHVGPGVIITPLARDRARGLGIRIERGQL